MPQRLGPSAPPARRGYAAGQMGVYQDPAALRRRRVQRRRRDVFVALLVGAAAALLLAMIPGLSVMWWVQILFDVALGVRRPPRPDAHAGAERQAKLTYIRRNAGLGPTRPRGARRAYDLGAGYDLDFRRVAN